MLGTQGTAGWWVPAIMAVVTMAILQATGGCPRPIATTYSFERPQARHCVSDWASSKVSTTSYQVHVHNVRTIGVLFEQVALPGLCIGVHMESKHLTIFTTAHPLDDVRVNSKFRLSFLDAGWAVDWIGPDRFIFEPSEQRRKAPGTTLFKHGRGKRWRLFSMIRGAITLALARPTGWVYCPDPDAALVAILCTSRRRASIIFDIHEQFHAAPLNNWLGGRDVKALRSVLRGVIRTIASRADVAISVNESLVREYAEHHKCGLVMRNVAPSSFGDDYQMRLPTGVTKFFHGKSAKGNGTPAVLGAVGSVPGTSVTIIPRAAGSSGGGYWSGFEEALQVTKSASRVSVIEPVPHKQMAQILDQHDVGLIAYGRDLGVTSLPNRLFEYMARGLAVMVPDYSKEIVPIVQFEKIGIAVDFEDVDAVARGMTWMRDHPDEVMAMGIRAREAFLARYSWEAEFESLRRAMESMELSG